MKETTMDGFFSAHLTVMLSELGEISALGLFLSPRANSKV
jgi:hypothetical protein